MRFKSMFFAGAAVAVLGSAAFAAHLPTKKAAPAEAKANCLDSFNSWLHSSVDECPLSYMGIQLYGTIDVGAGYMTNGSGFDRHFAPGVSELISKSSAGSRWNIVPNGISQSNVGVNVKEPVWGDFSVVGKAEIGFDPYSLQLANSPASLVSNNRNLLQNQTASGDSSRAGQVFNSQLFAGLSSKTFGTLVFGRVNALTTDGVNAYDPMGGSYAFSPIGYSGLTAGVGDTEDARVNTAFKYNVAYNGLRASALVQVGGYAQGNASSQGSYQVGIGGDFHGLSVDGIFSRFKDAVSLANYSSGTSLGLGGNPAYANTLKATLSNDQSVMLLAKYTWGPVKLFAGYENIQFYNPSDSFAGGFTSIAGIQVPGAMLGNPSQVTSNAYINTRVQQVMWLGAKYALRDDLDVAGAYYHYIQNNYNIPANAACGPNTTAPAPGYSPQGAANSKCAGTLDAISALIDYRPLKRVDLYAGVMVSQVGGGLANGYLKSNNLDPTVGLRIKF